MNPVLSCVLPVAGVLVVVGAAIGWDRWRAPRRDPRRPVAVVDWRTYRDACRRYERLEGLGDTARMYSTATAIRLWLASERHFGSARRRERLGAAYTEWNGLLGEFELCRVQGADQR